MALGQRSMHEQLRALRDIQELDLDIFRVKGELSRLPAERASRRGEIDSRARRREELQVQLRTLRAKIKEIEDHTTLQRQRMRKVETESNKTRGDAALLAAYQHERQALRREIGEAEEEGLQLVEQADELQKQIDQLGTEIGTEEESFAELASNVEREVSDAQKRLEVLQRERAKRLGTSIDPELLSLYERLLQAREGVALAELEGRICQGCFIEVPPNTFVKLARGRELIQCPSCDRILYLANV